MATIPCPFTCDWTRTVSWHSWVTKTAWKSVSASRAYKGKVGPGRAYSFLAGMKTIDNRGSSRPTTAIFKIRHKGIATWCQWSFSLAYSEPGPHPRMSCRNQGHVTVIRLKVLPRTMFTFTDIEVKYRWRTYDRFTQDYDVSGAGSWSA